MIRSLYYTPRKPVRKNIPPQEFGKLIREQAWLAFGLTLWRDTRNSQADFRGIWLSPFGD